jgi:K+-transporting ATPase ATPase A chain
MTWPSTLQYLLFLLVVTLLVKPVGGYLSRVFTGERTLLDPVLRPAERVIYRLCGVDPAQEMDWKTYAIAFARFGALGTLALYLILRLQADLPLHDATYQTTPMTVDLAANTAVSFATTTTWQAYGGETTMSYFSQMAGLTAQNFLAGAAGLAIGIAFIRGFARHGVDALGNFWVDLVRSLLWVLLPASIVGAVFLVWRGVPANLQPYTVATTLSGDVQVIAQGPVAALEFIKNLGTNGGGFFNVNGAHPFENPTPLTNFVEMLAIAVIPAALTNTFGRMVRRPRQGWVLYWVMAILFTTGLLLCGLAEQDGNPRVAAAGVDLGTDIAGESAPGGNMEGKETRFGIGGSVLAAIVTSNGATGSYNSMHDSFTPLGGAVPLVNMLLGEMIFGGLGTGLYSILMVALLGLFLSGLMIGRTPEYLGKRLGPDELRIITLYALASSFAILIPSAVAVVASDGLAGLTTNSGAHGFTEIFYAYTSSFTNNGQNFAGLSANSPFYNYSTAIAMLIGRIGLGVAALGLAGLLARQSRRTISTGSFPTDSPLFGSVVIGTALIVVGLSFLPAIALGPLIEHFGLS